MWSKVTGLNGRVMQEDWAEVSFWTNRIATVNDPTSMPTQYPNIYLSVASPNFPNYFTIGGPTGNWAQGSTLVSVRPPVFVISPFSPFSPYPGTETPYFLARGPSRIRPPSLPQDLLGKPPLRAPPPGTHNSLPRPPPNMADEKIRVGGKLSLMVQIAPREAWRAGTATLRLHATSPQNFARAPMGRLRDWAERRGREYVGVFGEWKGWVGGFGGKREWGCGLCPICEECRCPMECGFVVIQHASMINNDGGSPSNIGNGQ